MRGWRAAAIITGYLAFLAAVSLAVLSNPNAPQSYAEAATMGKTLFTWLAGFQMALIIFVTPASTADAISGERQRQTLDLLLATRLSSPSIVLGKLMAGLAFDVLLILCSLPLFSLVFLFGGVSPDQFVSMFVVFLATTLLLGSMALLISTITRRSGAAMVISMLCTLGLTVGLALVSVYLAVATASNNPACGGMPPIPITAYFDPLLGFAAALPDSAFACSTHVGGGPLNLALWQDQVIADLILSALFILGSVRLLRPHWVRR
jgi:ABC-type transport system involved in multi-copper enzyme maturation permease subunit